MGANDDYLTVGESDASLLSMPEDSDYMDVDEGDVIQAYRPDDIGKTFATASSTEKLKGFVAMTSIFIILLVALLLAAGALD